MSFSSFWSWTCSAYRMKAGAQAARAPVAKLTHVNPSVDQTKVRIFTTCFTSSKYDVFRWLPPPSNCCCSRSCCRSLSLCCCRYWSIHNGGTTAASSTPRSGSWTNVNVSTMAIIPSAGVYRSAHFQLFIAADSCEPQIYPNPEPHGMAKLKKVSALVRWSPTNRSAITVGATMEKLASPTPTNPRVRVRVFFWRRYPQYKKHNLSQEIYTENCS